MKTTIMRQQTQSVQPVNAQPSWIVIVQIGALFARRTAYQVRRLTSVFVVRTDAIAHTCLRLCLLSIVMLGGCQSLQFFTDTAVLSDESFSRLWRIYSHCRSSIEPDEMREDMQHLSRTLRRMSETMNRHSLLPQSVQRLIEEPPSRLSVDLGAMAIACALHAGQAAQADGRTHMAAELFGFVLSKDREPPYTYYVGQARLGLAQMQTGRAIERFEQVIKVSAH
jgi:hypothetical protein